MSILGSAGHGPIDGSRVVLRCESFRRDRAMFSDCVENTEVASGVSVRATTLKAAHGLPDRAVKDPAG
jgi:hypothetical protein